MPQSKLLRQLLDAPARPKRKPIGLAQVPTEPTFLELGGFEKAVDVVSRPLYASASFAHAMVTGGNPFAEAMRGFAGHRRTTYGDVLKATGMNEGAARAAMGFALDLLLDPTTYIGVGPARAAGVATIRGVPTALTKAGVLAREGAVAAKTLQAERVLPKLVQRSVRQLPLLPEGVPTRYERLVKGLPPEAQSALEAARMRWAPPQEAARIVGAAYGHRAMEKALAPRVGVPISVIPQVGPGLGRAGGESREFLEHLKLPIPEDSLKAIPAKAPPINPALMKAMGGVAPEAMRAPTALKFAGQPIVTGPQAAKALAPLGKAYLKVEEKVPIVGPALRFVRSGLVKAGGAAKAALSVKTGIPEFDYLRTRARDITHLKMEDAGEWWTKEIAEPIRKVFTNDPEKLKLANVELARSLEGVLEDAKRMEWPAARASLADRVEDLAKRLEHLTEKVEPYRALEAQAGAKIAEREAAKAAVPEQQLLALPTQRAAIEAEAAKLAATELRGKAKAMKQGDIIAQIAQYAKGGRISWADPKNPAANVEELVKSGVPKNLIGKPGSASRIDEVAEHFGMTSGELVAKIEDAAKARKAGKYVPGQAIQVPPSAMEAATERTFAKGVSAETAKIDREIAALKAKIAKAQGPERMVLEASIKGLESARAKAAAELAQVKPVEIIEQKRVPFVSKHPVIREVAAKYKTRMEQILTREKEFLNLTPEQRAFYMPHYLTPETREGLMKIIREDAGKILKADLPATVSNALRRKQQGGVLDLTLEDMIESGAIDPAKVKAALKAEGKDVSPFDLLAFEQDPVKAGLMRELAHVRAVTAAEMRDQVLASPTFTKASGNIADKADLARLKRVVQASGDHAIFIPTKSYIEKVMSPGQREALRQGKRQDFVHQMLVEAMGDELDEIAGAAASKGQEIKAYVVPREIAEHLSKAHAIQFSDESTRAFLRQYDQALGWWKVFATAARPAFHIRNWVSNLWQNFLAGLTSPEPYMKALTVLTKPEAAASVGRYSGVEVQRIARELGVLQSGFIGSDVGEFIERSVAPSRNPLSTSGPWARAGMKVGTSIENHSRMALFIDGLQKGMDPAASAMRVKKYLFDYKALSSFEKGVLRRIFPFYAWTRFNIPLQIETLITQPGKVAMLGKARAEAEKNFGGLDREYVADYIRESFGVPVRKNEKGEYEYFLLKGYIPTVDLAKLDAKELLGMLSPLVKAPVEQMLNTDFYRMKPIARFPSEKVQFMGVPMPARLAHLMRNVIIMQQIDREVFAEGATAGKGLLSELGIRMQAQDPMHQMKRFVLTTQVEMGDLKRAADRAREAGRETVAAEYDAQIALLTARRDRAKELVLAQDPHAFRTRKPKPKRSKLPRTAKGLKRQISLDALLKPKRKAQ